MYIAVGNIIKSGHRLDDIQCVLDTEDHTVQMATLPSLISSGVSVISWVKLLTYEYNGLIASLEMIAMGKFFGNFIGINLKGSNKEVNIGLTCCVGAHDKIRYYLTYFGEGLMRPIGYIDHYSLFGKIDGGDKMDKKDILGVEIPYEMYLYLVYVIKRHSINELNSALVPFLFSNIIGKGYQNFTWLADGVIYE